MLPKQDKPAAVKALSLPPTHATNRLRSTARSTSEASKKADGTKKEDKGKGNKQVNHQSKLGKKIKNKTTKTRHYIRHKKKPPSSKVVSRTGHSNKKVKDCSNLAPSMDDMSRRRGSKLVDADSMRLDSTAASQLQKFPSGNVSAQSKNTRCTRGTKRARCDVTTVSPSESQLMQRLSERADTACPDDSATVAKANRATKRTRCDVSTVSPSEPQLMQRLPERAGAACPDDNAIVANANSRDSDTLRGDLPSQPGRRRNCSRMKGIDIFDESWTKRPMRLTGHADLSHARVKKDHSVWKRKSAVKITSNVDAMRETSSLPVHNPARASKAPQQSLRCGPGGRGQGGKSGNGAMRQSPPLPTAKAVYAEPPICSSGASQSVTSSTATSSLIANLQLLAGAGA
jgi:hypothetical protein